MIRTIKQRVYVVGMLPLAVLAVVAVIANGAMRITEANETLGNAQRVTTALLHTPAVDALVVGNIGSFEKTANDVVRSSRWLACVILRDGADKVVVQSGECIDAEQATYSPVTVVRDGLSDFPQSAQRSAVGSLGILVEDDGIRRERRQVLVQLAASLVLIVAVVALIGKILKVRLIEPLQRVGAALTGLSERDYAVRVPVVGNDEVTQLARAVNNTVQTTEAYTRELELRRKDADRALQDADEANLLRDGLLKSLTDDFEGPINHMHSELTAIAMANQDPRLRERIKGVITILQDAQSDFADLMEIATSAQDPRKPASQNLAALLEDVRGDLQRLSEIEKKPIHFAMSLPGERSVSFDPNVMLDIDGIRLKKAIGFLARAMARFSLENGVFVNFELFKLSEGHLHLSVQVRAFYDPGESLLAVQGESEPLRDDLASLKRLGLTDREAKIVDYLLRAVGVAPSVSVLASGAALASLAMTCSCLPMSSSAVDVPERARSPQLSATLVSDDTSLLRLAVRSGISNDDVKLVTFTKAFANVSSLGRDDAVLLDVSGDVADALRMIDLLEAKKIAPAALIAICPQGMINDSLAERLLELGFRGVIQKPLYYSRLMQVIRATIDTANFNRGRDAHG